MENSGVGCVARKDVLRRVKDVAIVLVILAWRDRGDFVDLPVAFKGEKFRIMLSPLFALPKLANSTFIHEMFTEEKWTARRPQEIRKPRQITLIEE